MECGIVILVIGRLGFVIYDDHVFDRSRGSLSANKNGGSEQAEKRCGEAISFHEQQRYRRLFKYDEGSIKNVFRA